MSENQDHADVKFHPPILALLHILGAFVVNRFLPVRLPSFPLLGGFFVIIGLILGFTAIREFRKAHTTVDPHGSVSTVVINGPYRFVRNPIYLGFVCLLVGFPMTFGTWWGLLLVPVFMLSMNTLVIQHEEAYLEKKFGAKYTGYKSRVGRWI